MGIIRGQVLAWSLGGAQIEDQVDGSIQLTADADEVTTKDSTSNFREYLTGLKGWTGSLSGNYDPLATDGADEVIDDLITGSAITVLFTTGTAGNREWTGSAIITDVSIDAPLSGPATYSITFQGTGVPTAQNTSS